MTGSLHAAATPKPAAQKNSTAGHDPAFAFVSLEQIFSQQPKLKELGAKIDDEKAAAKKEDDARLADYQKLQAELATLNERMATLKEGDPGRAQATKERDAKADAIKAKEREIMEFRQKREQELQQKIAAVRDPLVRDIRAAAARLGNINLLFDFSGSTLSGLPFVVLHPAESEITARLTSALEGKDAGSVSSARDLKVAIIDMNKVFTQLQKTKDAEAKLGATRNEAVAENERRTNAYNEELAKLSSLGGAEKDQQNAKLRAMENDLNQFRASKTAEFQQAMLAARQPIIQEMSTALSKLGGEKVGLVFDSTGLSVAGAPILVWSKDLPDFTSILASILNGDSSVAEKAVGVPSSKLRFAVIDIDRAYHATPEGQKTEKEIDEKTKAAVAELQNADAKTRADRLQQIQTESQVKRRDVLAKILATLQEIGEAGGYNAVFDVAGETLLQVPAVVATKDIPNLTDDVTAKTAAAAAR